MTEREIYEELVGHFPGVALEFCEGQAGDPYILVPTDKMVSVCEMLKLVEIFAFDCLSDETAVDRNDSFELVYHLFSYRHSHSLVLKVKLPREKAPHINTVEELWPVANWYEREIYDLFGIVFDGHSDLRRIMMPEDWIGHPLRKDYKEEEDYRGIGTTRTPLLQ